ncbi:energy transducer TonB [Methylocystis sp. JAN1]|uniref:energy transducer TonB n=1 Tax=Methylocystis sp. JAN1 TaxID=3397211 RepID=UPI003FA2A99C
MTDFALSPEYASRRDEPPPGPPPVNPPWLRPVAIVAIVAVHVAIFAAFILGPKPEPLALSENYVDLESGDFVEQEEVSAAEDTPPPVAVEQPELALPPPVVMAPDAIPLAMKKEDVEKVEKKQEERKQVERAEQAREAQARRRAGSPEGNGRQGGAASASCLAHVAASLRSHTPGSTSLGAGTAHVTFHVNPGGGISGVAASGSTPAHAALARRIVSSSRGPGSCGSAFVAQSFAFH